MPHNQRVSNAHVDAHPRAPGRPRSVSGWLAARLVRALSAILVRLPEAPLHRVAYAVGGVLYRTQTRRRHLVRTNLKRVVDYLAEQGLATSQVSGAAWDERALDRMTRAAFGHYVRGYLEGAILPVYAKEDRLRRVEPDDPAKLELAFGSPDGQDSRALIVVGMHFGAIEIPALWATKRFRRRMTAPMETVADPELQSYFQTSRSKTGINLIPIEEAARVLRVRLADGEAVGLVADRAIGGSGVSVDLFGVPARLPLGPAALALESGAPAWLIATRRVDRGRYRARIERINMPSEGTRRERLSTFLKSEARAFELAVADAPEQWWTVFFPIWDDIPQ
jgi:phosphatidylinositol dimannoside acyltransferase